MMPLAGGIARVIVSWPSDSFAAVKASRIPASHSSASASRAVRVRWRAFPRLNSAKRRRHVPDRPTRTNPGSIPLDVVERLAAGNDWSFERASDDEITILVTGKWTDYQVSFTWMGDIEALHLACAFDLGCRSAAAPKCRR